MREDPAPRAWLLLYPQDGATDPEGQSVQTPN